TSTPTLPLTRLSTAAERATDERSGSRPCVGQGCRSVDAGEVQDRAIPQPSPALRGASTSRRHVFGQNVELLERRAPGGIRCGAALWLHRGQGDPPPRAGADRWPRLLR